MRRDGREGIISRLIKLMLILALLFGAYTLINRTIGFSGIADKVTGMMDSGAEKLNNSVDSANSKKNNKEKSGSRPYEQDNAASMDYLKAHVSPRGSIKGYSFKAFSPVGYSVTTGAAGWDYPKKQCTLEQAAKMLASSSDPASTDCDASLAPWRDEITGKSTYAGREIVVTSVVPLSEAWASGASKMRPEERKKILQDQSNVILTASKERNSQPIDLWHPNNVSCDYADRYAYVKAHYGLTVTQGEIDAITQIWERCQG